MNAAILLRCAGCAARIKAPAQLRGQFRSCPGCGHRFVVRAAAPRDEGPALVADDRPNVLLPWVRRA